MDSLTLLALAWILMIMGWVTTTVYADTHIEAFAIATLVLDAVAVILAVAAVILKRKELKRLIW